MSTEITNPTRHRHRSQIVAEAVVSAYIHELAPSGSARPSGRGRIRDRRACSESTNVVVRQATAVRAERRRMALRPGHALGHGDATRPELRRSFDFA